MLFILSSIAFLDRTNISVAGVQMREEYGLDQVHLGWVFSAFLVGYAAFQVPAGWLAGRIGPRRVLAMGVVWWGVFTALTALVSPMLGAVLPQLVLVRFLLGAGEAVVYPAGNQFVSQWIPAQERGKANGWIFAGVGMGAGLTPPLVTAIILWGGWRASFFVCALLGVAAGGIWYLAARDRPEDHPGMSSAELAHIRAGLPASGAGRHVATPWGLILSNRNVWALFTSYFAFGYVVWLFFSWFFIYLAEARHVDLKSSALYSMLPFIAMTVCCLAGGMVNDAVARRHGLFWGRCGIAVVAFILTAAFLVAGAAATDTTVAVLILAGGAGATYLAQSSFWSVTADFAAPHTGVVSGFMNMGCQIGGAITASLTPWIAAQFGWTAAFGTAAGFATVGAVAWLFVDPAKPLIRPGGMHSGAMSAPAGA
ncbi:MFS transporter [Sphingomonas quercus]|nr:MFS transporter [Sphingomonas quercus]